MIQFLYGENTFFKKNRKKYIRGVQKSSDKSCEQVIDLKKQRRTLILEYVVNYDHNCALIWLSWLNLVVLDVDVIFNFHPKIHNPKTQKIEKTSKKNNVCLHFICQRYYPYKNNPHAIKSLHNGNLPYKHKKLAIWINNQQYVAQIIIQFYINHVEQFQ